MKFTVKVTAPEKHVKETLLIPVYEGGKLTTAGQSIDASCQGFIKKILKQTQFAAHVGQILPLYQPGNSAYQHLVLVGCGTQASLSMANYRKIVISAGKALQAAKIAKAINFLPEVNVQNLSLAWKLKQATEAMFDGLYRFDLFKTKKDPLHVNEIIFAITSNTELKTADKAIRQGMAVNAGTLLARNLGNMPSNICTPSYLAEQAKILQKQHAKIKVKILDRKAMQKLGMGALLAVSQGSAEEPKFIIMEYHAGPKNAAPHVLVGKGITFDTGGNSIKPADAMVGMKYDMCGGASVFGTLKAAAELAVPLNIIGIVPAVENMPGGTAYKPEDILTSMSGQTIEVISTDAEGRLILADALTYCERYEPQAVIDIATLTGAVVIALGFHTTAVIGNDDKLAAQLVAAGNASYDKAWQLPMTEEYQEQIKSPFADMANTGGRSAGSITAACFLSRFTKKYPWVHLDVAGTAAMMTGTSERMATGRPVPMLTQYLLNQAKQAIND